MRRPDAGGILQYWPHVRYKSLSKDPNASRGKALGCWPAVLATTRTNNVSPPAATAQHRVKLLMDGAGLAAAAGQSATGRGTSPGG